MRIVALLLADQKGTYRCTPCVETRRHLQLGCSRMKVRTPIEPGILEIPDPRMRRGPFGRLVPSPPIRPQDCPQAYMGPQEARWVEMWGHVRASRDYLGIPAQDWPARDAAALSVLSEEVARIEAQQRAQEQPQPGAYRPGPGMTLEDLGASLAGQGVRRGR